MLILYGISLIIVLRGLYWFISSLEQQDSTEKQTCDFCASPYFTNRDGYNTCLEHFKAHAIQLVNSTDYESRTKGLRYVYIIRTYLAKYPEEAL